MTPRAPILVPIASQKLPPLCIHCRHYLPPPNKDVDRKHGYCQKSGFMNVVDGQVHYSNVAIVREYDCKGGWYEPANVAEKQKS